MKTIDAFDLKIGDVFCHELKLNGREAFVVTEVKPKSIFCKSRNTGNIVKKTRNQGSVILLRNEND